MSCCRCLVVREGRGLDEIGYALVTPEIPRLHEAFPSKLRRGGSGRLALDDCSNAGSDRGVERIRSEP